MAKALNKRRKAVNGSKVLVRGVAYKRNVSDTRESPAMDIIRLLEADGAQVDYHDPHVPDLRADHGPVDIRKRSVELSPEAVAKYDIVVLVTDHSKVDYEIVQQSAQLIFDSRDAFQGPFENVVKL